MYIINISTILPDQSPDYTPPTYEYPSLQPTIGQRITAGLDEEIAFLQSKNCTLESDDPDIRAFIHIVQAVRTQTPVEHIFVQDVNDQYASHFANWSDRAKHVSANRTRSIGKVAVINEDETAYLATLNNQQRHQFANEAQSTLVEPDDLAPYIPSVLDQITKEIYTHVSAATEFLTKPHKSFAVKVAHTLLAPIRRMSSDIVCEPTAKEVAENRRQQDGIRALQAAHKLMTSLVQDPTMATLESGYWSKALVEANTLEEHAMRITYGSMILLATDFHSRHLNTVAPPIDATHPTRPSGQDALLNIPEQPTGHTSKKRKHTPGRTQRLHPDNPITQIAAESIIIPSTLTISLPWINDGKPTETTNFETIEYQGETVIILNAMNAKLSGIAQDSRKKVHHANRNNPFDDIGHQVARLLAADIRPGTDASRYLVSSQKGAGLYENCKIWQAKRNNNIGVRGYYSLRTLEDLATGTSLSPSTKVLLVLAETDKQAQIEILQELFGATRAQLRSRRAGSI